MQPSRVRFALVVAGACIALVGCASAGSGTSAGGGSSPTAVAKSYFLALMADHRAMARSLVCPSGWHGSHSFRFAWVADVNPAHASARQLYGHVHPRAHRARDAWLVSLEPSHGPGSLPLFRVVQRGGRYFVCGYVKR